MKTLTFKYTKANGDSSERTLLTLSTPSDKYFGVDISSLDPYIAEEFSERAKALFDKYKSDLEELMREYDLKHNYRQFLESGVTQLTEI